jgi:outer membrane protein assembly factor BamB
VVGDFKADDPGYAKLGYRRDWTGFPFVSGGGRIASVKPAADGIIVQESGSTVTLLNTNTGSVRWSNTLAGPLTKFVGNERATDPNRGDVVLSASESELYILSALTGNQITHQSFSRVINTDPILAGDLAISGTALGELQGHSMGLGLRMWGFDTGSSIDFRPAIVGGILGVVNRSGGVYFLTAEGSLLGRYAMWAGVSTAPVSDGSLLYVASLDQSIYAFTPTAQVVWRVRTSKPLVHQPAVEGDTLWCTTSDGLTAFDTSNGSVRWTSPTVEGVVIGARRTNLVVRTDGGVALVDRASGDLVDRVPTPGVISITTDQFDNGTLYLATTAGTIVRLNPKD